MINFIKFSKHYLEDKRDDGTSRKIEKFTENIFLMLIKEFQSKMQKEGKYLITVEVQDSKKCYILIARDKILDSFENTIVTSLITSQEGISFWKVPVENRMFSKLSYHELLKFRELTSKEKYIIEQERFEAKRLDGSMKRPERKPLLLVRKVQKDRKEEIQEQKRKISIEMREKLLNSKYNLI